MNELFAYVKNDLTPSDMHIQEQDEPGVINTGDEDFNQSTDGAYDDTALNAKRLAFNQLQKCYQHVYKKWQRLPDAHNALVRSLAESCSLIDQNPARTDNGKVEQHLPHQKIFLAWALNRLYHTKGGICANAMGMGKSHQIISMILAFARVRRAHQRGQDFGSTLLVVPGTRMEDWWDRIRHELVPLDDEDDDWETFIVSAQQWQQPSLANKKKDVRLLPTNEAFHTLNHRQDHKVFLASYEYLSNFDPNQRAQLKGLFRLVIFDEVHHIRHFAKPEMGDVIQALEAEERICAHISVAYRLAGEHEGGLLSFFFGK